MLGKARRRAPPERGEGVDVREAVAEQHDLRPARRDPGLPLGRLHPLRAHGLGREAAGGRAQAEQARRVAPVGDFDGTDAVLAGALRERRLALDEGREVLRHAPYRLRPPVRIRREVERAVPLAAQRGERPGDVEHRDAPRLELRHESRVRGVRDDRDAEARRTEPARLHGRLDRGGHHDEPHAAPAERLPQREQRGSRIRVDGGRERIARRGAPREVARREEAPAGDVVQIGPVVEPSAGSDLDLRRPRPQPAGHRPLHRRTHVAAHDRLVRQAVLQLPGARQQAPIGGQDPFHRARRHGPPRRRRTAAQLAVEAGVETQLHDMRQGEREREDADEHPRHARRHRGPAHLGPRPRDALALRPRHSAPALGRVVHGQNSLMVRR